jgi:hypothetical protein
MRDDVTVDDGLIFILFVLIFCLGSTLGYITTFRVCKNQAYKAGVGQQLTKHLAKHTGYLSVRHVLRIS